jgi:hypothetical protein
MTPHTVSWKEEFHGEEEDEEEGSQEEGRQEEVVVRAVSPGRFATTSRGGRAVGRLCCFRGTPAENVRIAGLFSRIGPTRVRATRRR